MKISDHIIEEQPPSGSLTNERISRLAFEAVYADEFENNPVLEEKIKSLCKDEKVNKMIRLQIQDKDGKIVQDDAARAYNLAAINHHGEFAQLNIIQ